MDPNLKLVLDELNRRFDEQDEKWERRFSDQARDRAARDAALDTRLTSLESACSGLEYLRLAHANDDRDSRVTALEVAATDLGTWRPEVEALVDDLTLEVKRISTNWDQQLADSSSRQLEFQPSPSSASAQPAAGSHADGPIRHCTASNTRGTGSGVVTAWNHIPANGTTAAPHLPISSVVCVSVSDRPSPVIVPPRPPIWLISSNFYPPSTLPPPQFPQSGLHNFPHPPIVSSTAPLHFSLPASAPPIFPFKHQLRQIFINLSRLHHFTLNFPKPT